jgi:hypothetical protein
VCMTISEDIRAYIDTQPEPARSVENVLATRIDAGLPEAESKVWHGHPVWFLAGNPVAGFATRKHNVQLLFWSGQSFDEPGLRGEGSFKAAQIRFDTADDVDVTALDRWLEKSRRIQWDYKNIRRRKGLLTPLTADTH